MADEDRKKYWGTQGGSQAPLSPSLPLLCDALPLNYVDTPHCATLDNTVLTVRPHRCFSNLHPTLNPAPLP